MNTAKEKQVMIVAGANGSGKTTFAKKYLETVEEKYEFLNADEFAKQMSPEDPSKARIAAGRKVINLLTECTQQGKNIAIESTLAGSFLEKHIRELKECGYEISLTFIFLASRELCIERIKSRVMKGGHDVPDEDVKRRYIRGLSNFWNAYRPLADYITLIFNNEYYDFKRVAYGTSKEVTIIDNDLYKIFFQELESINNET
jgi:predicted ABC-type ATPase